MKTVKQWILVDVMINKYKKYGNMFLSRTLHIKHTDLVSIINCMTRRDYFSNPLFIQGVFFHWASPKMLEYPNWASQKKLKYLDWASP